MADPRNWSQTAASNTDYFPEGMAPSAVNDGARAVQAAIAKLIADEGGTLTLGGTATAYTLTLNTAPSTLADGLFFSATANVTATGGATTLVVTPSGGSAFASKKIKTYQGGAEGDPDAGCIIAGNHYLFQYDSAADGGTGAYILLNPTRATASNAEALGGTDAFKVVTSAALASAKSLGANGYMKLPGGLILQWGQRAFGGGSSAAVTFPTAFPTACASIALGGNANVTAWWTSPSTSGFTMNISTAGSMTIEWIAIGY